MKKTEQKRGDSTPEKVAASTSRVAAESGLRLLEASPYRMARLSRIEGMLGSTSGMTCLLVGGEPAMLSRFARLGGTWHAAARTPEALDECRLYVDDRACLMKDSGIPLDDGRFDRVVVVDVMEFMEDDYAFVAECHRVMQASGRLVVNVVHAKHWSFLKPLRRLVGLEERTDLVRPGYSGAQLFDVLKDGFDMEEVRDYSRFFSESTEIFVRLGAGYLFGASDEESSAEDAQPEPDTEKLARYLSRMYPFGWLAARLDALLFLARGHFLVARARRRIWRPRRTPILHDGRSIAEATLRTKIGTATPYGGANVDNK